MEFRVWCRCRKERHWQERRKRKREEGCCGRSSQMVGGYCVGVSARVGESENGGGDRERREAPSPPVYPKP